MTNRRQFLAGSTQLAMLAGFPGLTLAQEAADARLVLVILRGGMDGLAANDFFQAEEQTVHEFGWADTDQCGIDDPSQLVIAKEMGSLD